MGKLMDRFEMFECLVPSREAFYEEKFRRQTEALSKATHDLLYTLLAGFNGPGRIDLMCADEAVLRASAALFEKVLRRKGWLVRVTPYPTRWYRALPYVLVEG